MSYDPLKPGGAGDYPIKVGSMLLTLVDPHQGHEVAYNRWYERDHYYAGCLIGPWLFAGSRWVATRELKNRRWPQDDETVARPPDAGSYVAIYWVEQGHHDEHFHWARVQVRQLYGEGRGFPERTHVHTILYDHLGAVYRDDDPVPVELALDARYDGLVIAWFDGNDGRDARALHDELAPRVAKAIAGSPIEIASSWTPSAGENEPKNVPMDLGSAAGGPERLAQLFFVRGDVTGALDALRAYTDGVAGDGVATVHLVAPFHHTVIGTDRYVDELW